jgi:hypothetical protein
MNSAPHNKTARVTATRPSTEVVAPTSRSLFLDAGRDFGGSTKWCVAGAQTPNIDPEPVRGYPSIHLRIHIRNAFVAAEYSMSVSRNAHLLMRSPPHERFTYVALPTRFALTGRGLRTQHHITGKTTFRTGLPP